MEGKDRPQKVPIVFVKKHVLPFFCSLLQYILGLSAKVKEKTIFHYIPVAHIKHLGDYLLLGREVVVHACL